MSSPFEFYSSEQDDLFGDILQRQPCKNVNREWNPCSRLARRGCNTCSQCNKVAKQQEDKTIKTEIIRKRQALLDFQVRTKKTKMVVEMTKRFKDVYSSELTKAQMHFNELSSVNRDIDNLFKHAAFYFGEDLMPPTPPSQRKTPTRSNSASRTSNASDSFSEDSLFTLNESLFVPSGSPHMPSTPLQATRVAPEELEALSSLRISSPPPSNIKQEESRRRLKKFTIIDEFNKPLEAHDFNREEADLDNLL